MSGDASGRLLGSRGQALIQGREEFGGARLGADKTGFGTGLVQQVRLPIQTPPPRAVGRGTYHTARLPARRDPDAANGALNSWRPEIETMALFDSSTSFPHDTLETADNRCSVAVVLLARTMPSFITRLHARLGLGLYFPRIPPGSFAAIAS